METRLNELTHEFFQVEGNFDNEPYKARLLIENDYYEEEENGECGEYAYSDSWYEKPLIIPIKNVTVEDISKALTEQDIYCIDPKTYDNIEKWLKDEPTETPLDLNFEKYESYKGWSGTGDGFDGFANLVARLETFEDFIKWETSQLTRRFAKG